MARTFLSALDSWKKLDSWKQRPFRAAFLIRTRGFSPGFSVTSVSSVVKPIFYNVPVFENLSEKLNRAFKNLRGQGKITEENIGEALREIRLALLEADVNVKVVKDLIDHIREKALGAEVMTALTPAEQIVKIVRDELVGLLGKDTAKFKFASQPPTSFLWQACRVPVKPPPPANSRTG